ALERRLIDPVGATQALDGLVRRRDAEVGLDQLPLHVFEPGPVSRGTGEETAKRFPEPPPLSPPHYRRPRPRPRAPSAASATSPQRSRRPPEASRAVASPGCAVSTGARGNHSSEYVSTTTMPCSDPPLSA